MHADLFQVLSLLGRSDDLKVNLNTNIAPNLHQTCSCIQHASVVQLWEQDRCSQNAGGAAPHVGAHGMGSPYTQHEGWRCQSPGLLEGSFGCVGEVSHGPGSWDHEHAELARPTDLCFSCLLPPSWPLPRNAHRYKTDFVFRMFSSIDSKGCIKTFLWGWLSTGENRAGAPDQSIPGHLPTECHVLVQGGCRGGPSSLPADL